jgi:hypothetical protein
MIHHFSKEGLGFLSACNSLIITKAEAINPDMIIQFYLIDMAYLGLGPFVRRKPYIETETRSNETKNHAKIVFLDKQLVNYFIKPNGEIQIEK